MTNLFCLVVVQVRLPRFGLKVGQIGLQMGQIQECFHIRFMYEMWCEQIPGFISFGAI